MRRAILETVAIFALLALAGCTILLTHDAHRISQASEKTMADIDAAVKAQSMNLSADEAHLDSVLNQVDKAAAEQRAYWQKISVDSDHQVKALGLVTRNAESFFYNLDKQVNGSLLPDLDGQIKLTAGQLNLTAQSAQSAFASFGHTSDALGFQVNQLDLGPMFANLDESSARLATTMGYLQSAGGHADNILGAGEKTALYYEKKLTTPASFARKLSDFILQSGSEARILFVGH